MTIERYGLVTPVETCRDRTLLRVLRRFHLYPIEPDGPVDNLESEDLGVRIGISIGFDPV